jgi:DNA anti-recombination protein RmuC
MKKWKFKSLAAAAVVGVLLLTGCVSTEQLSKLADDASVAELRLSAIETQTADMKAAFQTLAKVEELEALSAEVSSELQQTRKEIADELNAATAQVSEEILSVRQETSAVMDAATAQVSNEILALRQETADIIRNYTKNENFTRLADRVTLLENELALIQEVIGNLAAYGKYTDSEDFLTFLYGLVDIYDTLEVFERNLFKLKEAMRMFVAE